MEECRGSGLLGALLFGGGSGGGGGGASALVVTVTEEQTGEFETTYTADKTAGQIIGAMPLAYTVDVQDGKTTYVPILQFEETEDGYDIEMSIDGGIWLHADTLNDYPVYAGGGK